MPKSTNAATVARQNAATSALLGADVLPRRVSANEIDRSSRDASPGNGASSAGEPTMSTISSAEATAAGVPDELPADAKAEALQALLERYECEFPHDILETPHTRIVWGEGDPNASLMLIGEAPGADEDRTGRPFVGRAGQKLTEIVASMGLEREKVFITNIIKVRPPNNRTPFKHEVEASQPWLAEQIVIVRPKVIVTLGGPSTKLMLNTDTGITRLRGIWSEYADPKTGLRVPVMPTFHPAYLLRQYTVENRRKVWSDMQAALERLGET